MLNPGVPKAHRDRTSGLSCANWTSELKAMVLTELPLYLPHSVVGGMAAPKLDVIRVRVVLGSFYSCS